ncbi:DUF732 domain-containing protein [Streptomyces sp. NPDC050263]|uniref:DUF732 domain-containing protein n=1 Tax=Streptomyces sp. NPDC050263 TaxID=3155037 RepID=UPI00341E80FA
MSKPWPNRIAGVVLAVTISLLTLTSAGTVAHPSADSGSTVRTAANSAHIRGNLSSPDLSAESDSCGPPGALPGIFRCDSEQPEVDGGYDYDIAFINAFRAQFPYFPLDNNQIVQWGRAVCQVLKTSPESAVLLAFVNAGWSWDAAAWLLGSSENVYCPSLRDGDIVIPGAP